MEILNYTGSRITVSGESTGIITTLASEGFAQCEVQTTQKVVIDMVPVYRKEYGNVKGLPAPDPNRQKLYVVSKDVAEAAGPRFDLLIYEDPQTYNGSTFYKLVNV